LKAPADQIENVASPERVAAFRTELSAECLPRLF